MTTRSSHFLPWLFALVRSIAGECTLPVSDMPRPLPSLALVVSLLLPAACSSLSYTVTPVRAGGLYTSKGDRCGIRFDNLNFQEGLAKYENLGMVTLSGG